MWTNMSKYADTTNKTKEPVAFILYTAAASGEDSYAIHPRRTPRERLATLSDAFGMAWRCFLFITIVITLWSLCLILKDATTGVFSRIFSSVQ